MIAVTGRTAFRMTNRRGAGTGEHVVQHGADAANGETENQALDIKAGALRQVEQAGRVPVFRDKQGFGQAERGGEQAGPAHGAAVGREGGIDDCPGKQKGAGPYQPDKVIGHVTDPLYWFFAVITRILTLDRVSISDYHPDFNQDRKRH